MKNSLKNLAVGGYLLTAGACVNAERQAVQTVPMIEIALAERPSDLEEMDSFEPNEDDINFVELVREFNKRFIRATNGINAIRPDGGLDNDAKCEDDPAILAIQQANRDNLDEIIYALNGTKPSIELLDCVHGRSTDESCNGLLGAPLGRLYIEGKKGTIEYYESLLTCLQGIE